MLRVLGHLKERMPLDREPLEPEQIRKLALWIDTGAARADAPAYFADHQRPTLFVHSPRRNGPPLTRIELGAADLDSPPVRLSVRASWDIAGRRAGAELSQLFAQEGDVFSLELPEPFTGEGELTVQATDTSGNTATIVRAFNPSRSVPMVARGAPPVPNRSRSGN
jgi:hypothetical protein